MLSVLNIGFNGDPALIFADNLDHALWRTRCILVFDVSVVRVVHHSEIVGHINLIAVIFCT